MNLKVISYILMTFLLCMDTNGDTEDIIFRTDFEARNSINLTEHVKFADLTDGYNHTRSLCISVSEEDKKTSNTIILPIDLSAYRGYKLMFECMVKADKVSKPSQSYLGVKFMLHYESPIEGTCWLNESNVYGTFNWKKLQFTKRIAPDASTGEIVLGLQDSSGTVWFDNIEIKVLDKPLPIRPAPQKNPSPTFRGHRLPRLRGVMSPQTFKEEDFTTLNRWNVNVIRWQMTRHWNKSNTDRDLDEYDKWLGTELDELDKVLAICKKTGIKVVVDLHSPPGGRYKNNDLAIFNEPEYQEHFINLWKQIARRYKGNSAIWGYDLINEPVQNLPSPEGVDDYLKTQVRAAEAIREIDPVIPIFIEASNWSSPIGYTELTPVNVSNIIYEVHMYAPYEFTHQGVYNEWKPVKYPGKIGETIWEKEKLRKVLQPVREFQLAYNVHIYVGEFSAVRWAPGAEEYLSDCISIFEEYGWDWTYHAYREWDGWSIEHDEDPKNHQKAQGSTKRKKLFLKWFNKNIKDEE